MKTRLERVITTKFIIFQVHYSTEKVYQIVLWFFLSKRVSFVSVYFLCVQFTRMAATSLVRTSTEGLSLDCRENVHTAHLQEAKIPMSPCRRGHVGL